MAEYIFEGGYQGQSGSARVKLFLIHFQDESEVHFIYSPHLDLTGYGYSVEEARDSFKIVFEDFIDYTMKKMTLGKLLSDLGWKLKGSAKKPKRVLAPSITSVIKNNSHVSDIFDKYSAHTYHQEVGIPSYA